MPIVIPEVSCFPKDLLTNLPDDIAGRQWLVAHTMARQEKSLSRDLLARRVPYYLPLIPRRLSYVGRNLVSHRPAFSGFVFLFANNDERRICLSTGRVARVLYVADQSRMTRELQRVAERLEAGSEVFLTDALSLAEFDVPTNANA